jgi:GH15 family glucan-1,4-alpha-glucosidase
MSGHDFNGNGRSDYLPIGDRGVIGDLRSAALVGTDGTIDWYCAPRFDSPSVFGAILDRDKGGFYRIAPVAESTTKQLYFPETNVLITRFLSRDGVAELQDFMPVDSEQPQRVVRRVVCVRGRVRLRLTCEPRFDYARQPHDVEVEGTTAVFRSPDLVLSLTGAQALTSTGTGVTAEIELAEGETSSFVLRNSSPEQFSEAAAEACFEETVAYWRTWVARSQYTGRWREMVNRSALALKLLQYEPSGAIIAAVTTSLPEQLGGPRNWDYRFSWIRDSAFSIYALMRLGFIEEAQAYGQFIQRSARNTTANGSGPLKIMYGIDGQTYLPEETLDHLEGYAGSRPVRIGNDAADQLQLDIYGELLDAAYIAEFHGDQLMPYDAWIRVREIVEWLCENWPTPDEGIWETRGGRQQFTHSRLMCWVALDRAIRIARKRGFPADLVRWMSVRDEIFHALMTSSWSDEKQAFVQHSETDVLDASVLLMPLVHFIAPTDPRWLSTLDAVGRELVSDSLVYRYDPAASPDGLDGDEGTFSICTFWYVDALTRAGRLREAQLAFEKMLTYANHLGLYSEEIGSSGELLGNFPQAFTHLALISAAVNLDQRLG